jgi:hypothetical protein
VVETIDTKMELLKRSAKHRDELEKEVKLISERTENILTNALIIGGTLAAAYLIVRTFSGRSVKKKSRGRKINILPAAVREAQTVIDDEPSSPGIVSQIGTALASQATIFLLGLAKEKLSEYLQAPSEKKVEQQ